MARSHRKNPITPNYSFKAGRGKYDKKLQQKRMRSLERKFMFSEKYEYLPKIKKKY